MQIPIYQRHETIPGAMPDARGSLMVAGQVGEAMAGFGRALARFERQKREMRQATELSNKSVSAATDLSDLYENWKTAPMPDASQFIQGAEAIRQRYLNSIKDSVVKGMFNDHFKRIMLQKRVHAQEREHQGQVEHAVATLDEDLNNIVVMAARTNSIEEMGTLMGMGHAAITGRVASGVIPEARGVEIHRQFLGRVETAHVQSIIQDDPQEALKMMNDPKVFPWMDPQLRLDLKKQANQRIESEAREADRRDAAVKAIQQSILESARTEYREGAYQKFVDRELTYHDIDNSPLDPREKKTWRNQLDQQTAADNEGRQVFKVTDPQFYLSQLHKIYDGQGKVNPNTVYPVDGKLSQSDARYLRTLAGQLKDQAFKPVRELLKLAIEDGRRQIVKGNSLIGFDASEVRDAYLYEHALRQALAQGEEASKNPMDMLTPGTKDYIVDKTLAPFLKTPQERLRDQARRLTQPSTSGGDVTMRKPGETVEQYLKRTSQ